MLREKITDSVDKLGRRLVGALWPMYARVVRQRLNAMTDDELRELASFVRSEATWWGVE